MLNVGTTNQMIDKTLAMIGIGTWHVPFLNRSPTVIRWAPVKKSASFPGFLFSASLVALDQLQQLSGEDVRFLLSEMTAAKWVIFK